MIQFWDLNIDRILLAKRQFIIKLHKLSQYCTLFYSHIAFSCHIFLVSFIWNNFYFFKKSDVDIFKVFRPVDLYSVPQFGLIWSSIMTGFRLDIFCMNSM